jgi:hypothetical protein
MEAKLLRLLPDAYQGPTNPTVLATMTKRAQNWTRPLYQCSLIEASVLATLFPGRPTPRQVKEGIQESFNVLKEARAKSLELWEEFLWDRAKNSGSKNVEKALKAIRKAERLKNHWRKLKISFRGNLSHGLFPPHHTLTGPKQ